MKHVFYHGTNGRTLLLLHGTGGDEHDLVPLAKSIDPEANILSVRGNVIENGMPRFFKRIRPGIFDLNSLEKETHALYKYIDEASKKYGFDRSRVIAIGYSNGANIASSVMLFYDNPFLAALLFRPMVPIRDLSPNNLSKVDILILSGKTDPIVSSHEVDELENLFKTRGASLTVNWMDTGHQITMDDVLIAQTWYHNHRELIPS